MTDQLITLRDWVRYGASEFAHAGLWYGHGTSNNWDEALALVLGFCHIPFANANDALDAKLLPNEIETLKQLIRKRADLRIPVPYLLGEAWYYGVPFTVTEDTLIPRSPIGELIEKRFAPIVSYTPESVLDLCCGSGCIGIRTALELPETEVDIADISADALNVAQQNIWRHEVDYQVTPYLSDGFKELPEKQYDLILTNPPYVDHDDFYSMPAEYQHEPELALVCGEDGLDLVIDILAQSSDFLTQRGVLICEVGNSWGHLAELFPDVPFKWIDFEFGGHGVFWLTQAELLQHKSLFVEASR